MSLGCGRGGTGGEGETLFWPIRGLQKEVWFLLLPTVAPQPKPLPPLKPRVLLSADKVQHGLSDVIKHTQEHTHAQVSGCEIKEKIDTMTTDNTHTHMS